MATEYSKIKRKYNASEATLISALGNNFWGLAEDTGRIIAKTSAGTVLKYVSAAELAGTAQYTAGAYKIGIYAISGLTSNNVQDALAELAASGGGSFTDKKILLGSPGGAPGVDTLEWDYTDKHLNVLGIVVAKSTTVTTPTAGKGVYVYYNSATDIGYIKSHDYTTPARRPLQIESSTLAAYTSGTIAIDIGSTQRIGLASAVASSTYRVYIPGTTDAVNSDLGALRVEWINSTNTGSGATQVGAVNIRYKHNVNSHPGDIAGLLSITQLGDTDDPLTITAQSIIGGQFTARYQASGTQPLVYGILTSAEVRGNGVITNAYSNYANPPTRTSGSGTITNSYSFYIPTSSLTGVTNAWGFYSADTIAHSFNGKLLIKTDAPVTENAYSESLRVKGPVKIYHDSADVADNTDATLSIRGSRSDAARTKTFDAVTIWSKTSGTGHLIYGFIKNEAVGTSTLAAGSFLAYNGNNSDTTSVLTTLYGINIDARNRSSQTVDLITGIDSTALSVSGAVNTARAGTFSTQNAGTGTFTTAHGVYAAVSNASSGVITNAASFYGKGPSAAAGTITNAYTCYLTAPSVSGGGVITNQKTLYVAGGDSYFGGYLHVGGSSASFPLDVQTVLGSTFAKFGSATGGDIYVYNACGLGFNCYYNSGYKYGKGSTSEYAGVVEFNNITGILNFAFSSTGGAADASVSAMNTRMRLDSIGNLYLPAYASGRALFIGTSGLVDVDSAYQYDRTNLRLQVSETLIGKYPASTGYACFSHTSMIGAGQYCLLQSTAGTTYLNSASGQSLHLQIAGDAVASLSQASGVLSINLLGNDSHIIQAAIGDLYLETTSGDTYINTDKLVVTAPTTTIANTNGSFVTSSDFTFKYNNINYMNFVSTAGYTFSTTISEFAFKGYDSTNAAFKTFGKIQAKGNTKTAGAEYGELLFYALSNGTETIMLDLNPINVTTLKGGANGLSLDAGVTSTTGELIVYDTLTADKKINLNNEAKSVTATATWTSGTDFTGSFIDVTSVTAGPFTITLAGGNTGDTLRICNSGANPFNIQSSAFNTNCAVGKFTDFIKASSGWCQEF